MSEFKVAITKALDDVVDEDSPTDSQLVLVALCDTALEYGCLLIGKEPTLALFRDMAFFAKGLPDHPIFKI